MGAKIKGLKELIRVLSIAPQQVNKRIPDLLIAEGKETERELKRSPTPIDNGDLRQSMNASRVGSKTLRVRANATNLAPYAAAVEYGTKPHVIRPKNAKAFKFKIGPDTIYAKQVKHPGTKAQPFFEPAIERLKKRFVNNLKVLINRELEK